MKSAFNKLAKDVKKRSGIDLESSVVWGDNYFETDLHVVETGKGDSIAVRQGSGVLHVTGFIFPVLALGYGFDRDGRRYVWKGGAEKDAEVPSDESAELAEDPE